MNAKLLYAGLLIVLATIAISATAHAETIVFSQGFEASDGGFTHAGTNNQWQWGAPTNPTGPGSAHQGLYCWGAGLTANVRDSTDSSLTSPAIAIPELSPGENAFVRFYGWVGIDYMYDRAQFQVSADGTTWTTLAEFYSVMQGGWQPYYFNVSQYAGSNTYLNFRLVMDGSYTTESKGFYIDDIAVIIVESPATRTIFTLNAYEQTGGSCPWIYGWNGTAYVAENDIYSTARGASQEYTDYYSLNAALQPKDGFYSVDLREVDNEYSFTDQVKLITVDHASGVSVASDERGRIWTYVAPASPALATGASGSDVSGTIAAQDDAGVKLYNGNYVLLDFGNLDTTQDATLVLRAKGFLSDADVGTAISAPPRIFVQTMDAGGNWVTVGWFYPRMEWSTAAYDLSGYLSNGKVVRLYATSCNEGKYHLLDYVGLDTAPQMPVVVNELSPVGATNSAGLDMLDAIATSDGSYATMNPSESISLSFPVPAMAGDSRDMVFVSEGYYVPTGTFFIYTWDGASWAQRDAWTNSHNVYESHIFDLSPWLPDPDGEFKIRVWQDYQYEPAGIGYAGLTNGGTPGVLSAFDARTLTTVTSQLASIDGSYDQWAMGSYPQVRNRWVDLTFTGIAVTPPLSAGTVIISGGETAAPTFRWTGADGAGNPLAKYQIEVWTGTGGIGDNMWSSEGALVPDTVATYGGGQLTGGHTYYARVKLFDGNSWGSWSEASWTSTLPVPESVMQLASASYSVAENGGKVTIQITRDQIAGTPGVQYTTGDFTALAGKNYTAKSGTATFAEYNVSCYIDVPVLDNTMYDSQRQFFFNISSPAGGSLGATMGAVITLTENDPAPTVRFSSSTYSVAENGGYVTITVQKSGSITTQPFSVQYATSPGTATAPADYTTTSGTLNFAAGDTSKTFTVPITDNDIYQAARTFGVTLSSPVGCTMGTPGTTTVTITENDPTPVLQFSSATYSAAENGGSVTITVTKTGTTTQSCSVSYATADGTAVRGVNYTSASGTLSFASGDTSKTFTVTVADNTVYDVNKNFGLALSSPTGCTLGALNTAVVTIAENDPAPVVQIAIATYGVAENAGKVTIQLSRTGSSPAWPCSVNYATADGTGTAGKNYTATSGTATFPAGNGTYYIDVPVPDNSYYDAARTFTLSISSPGNCTLGATTVTTVTITENDPAPTVSIASATYTAAENGGKVTIAFTRTGTMPVWPCSINYATADGTGTAGKNYTATSGTATFPADNGTFYVDLPLIDNSYYDVTRTFTLSISSPSNCTLGTPGSTTVTIMENDPAPVVQIASATYGIAENAGKVTIQLSRTGSSPAWPCSINYATADGTATATANYTATSGTATFPADNGTYYIDVPLIDNTVYDIARTFTLSISSPGNCTLGATTATTVTVTENDPAPTVRLSSSAYSVAENGGFVTITVTKTGLTNLPCSVQYATSDGNATAGLNYTSASGSLDFAPGDTSKTFTVTVADNAMYDLDRYFNVELSTPVGCTSGTPHAATVTITEDDAVPTVQFSADAYSVDEAAGTVTITVTRTGLTTRPFSVRYAASDGNATAGTDYTAASGTLDFATGDMSRTFQVPVIDRHIVGTSVCFTVALSDPSTCTVGSRATASVHIQQNDVAPVADFHANVTAGIGILCVGFVDDSVGYPAAWSWDFGDAAFGTANSTLENPAHVYTSPGTYTVTLTAINANGTSTRQRTTYITLLPYPPEAGFTADMTHGQVPLTIRFNDTSSNTPDTWHWSFGDGSANETTQNVTHTYKYPGRYNVTLTASNPGGNGTVQKTGYITVTPGNQSTIGEDWWYDNGNPTVTPTPTPTATPTPAPNATATPTPTPTAVPTAPASATPIPGFSWLLGLTALVALGAIAGLRREH